MNEQSPRARDGETGLLTDPRAVAGLIGQISQKAKGLTSQLTFMEVCGTHTHAVAMAGLRQMLPSGLRLISGPGCPVCVTPVDYLDRALALAALPGTLVCTFGDLLRVPSSTVSLERSRAEGASIRIVYSPRDALEIARQNPSLRVVLLAIGFETTAPTAAAALAEAEASGVENLLVLAGNKVMPPPMKVLADDSDLRIDGFLLPGHVSVITGWKAFSFLAEVHGVSGAVVGFAPTDILRGALHLMSVSDSGAPSVANLYGRAVNATGNAAAHELVDRFFEPVDASWRGFGTIPGSGLGLRDQWRHRDAATIAVELPPPKEPKGCRCGDVLRGAIDPPSCPLFGDACNPDAPQGACMVSSEGTCAAWYRHEPSAGRAVGRPGRSHA